LVRVQLEDDINKKKLEAFAEEAKKVELKVNGFFFYFLEI
jgi:hypothetical protein